MCEKREKRDFEEPHLPEFFHFKTSPLIEQDSKSMYLTLVQVRRMPKNEKKNEKKELLAIVWK